jgi:micrococcal nuclease
MRRLLILVLFVIALPCVAMAQGADSWKNRAVISVIDGDTIVLDNGEVVRLIGLLSPRAPHGKNPGEPFGEQAKNITEEMLLGNRVEIGFDVAYGGNGHRDKYGRALAYITITRGAERVFVNLELLERGAGYFVADSEQLQFSDVFQGAEVKARQRKAGLWAKTDKSPVEVAAAAGKQFEEPSSSVNLIYIRPSTPIVRGPGGSVASAQTGAHGSNSTAGTGSKHTSLAMDDLRKLKPIEERKPEKPIDPDEGLYDIKERKPVASFYDEGKKFEVYKATTKNNKSDYRVTVRQGEKEITFITNFDGIKSFSRLLSKGTDSQPVLTAVESAVGSINGTRGSINVTTGKDGGLVLNIAGRDGAAKFYLTRLNALGLQIRIGNLIP